MVKLINCISMQCLTLIQTCNTDSDLPEMEVSMVMSTGTEVLEVGPVVKVTLTSSNLGVDEEPPQKQMLGQSYNNKLFIEIKMKNSTAMASTTSNLMIKQFLLNISYKKGKKPSYNL